ncbi:Ig-like domain-containing protein [Vibrio barjaei]|uniref:Ig-like domain-containing protein n=1 Tax=Vibrio barjaei TaxID=1676683 RepID=UPI002284DB1E|nr:Ig-like domain-containing protein [Vibrio barjaei]MCY9870475.1 Ig-like domain-containing protein [Vibrio barjaei]
MRYTIAKAMAMAMLLAGCNSDSPRNPIGPDNSGSGGGGGDSITSITNIYNDGTGELPQEFEYITAVPLETANGYTNGHLPIGEPLEYKIYGFDDGTQYDITSAVTVSSDPQLDLSRDELNRIYAIGSTVGSYAANFAYNDNTADSSIKVVAAEPISLTAYAEEDKLRIGVPVQARATLGYTDGSEVDVTPNVAWSTTDSDTLTVSAGGRMDGVKPGIVEVTATHLSTAFTDSFDLEVDFDPLQSISVTSSDSEIDIGQKATLKVIATFLSGAEQDVMKWSTYSVLTPGVVDVPSVGVVEGLAQGSSNVEILFGGLITNAYIDVTADPYVPPAATVVGFVVEPLVWKAGHFENSLPVGKPMQYRLSYEMSDGTTVPVPVSELTVDILAVSQPKVIIKPISDGIVQVLPIVEGVHDVEFSVPSYTEAREIQAVTRIVERVMMVPTVSEMAVGDKSLVDVLVFYTNGDSESALHYADITVSGDAAVDYSSGELQAVESGLSFVEVSIDDAGKTHTETRAIRVVGERVIGLEVNPSVVMVEQGSSFAVTVMGRTDRDNLVEVDGPFEFVMSSDLFTYSGDEYVFTADKVGTGSFTIKNDKLESNLVTVIVSEKGTGEGGNGNGGGVVPVLPEGFEVIAKRSVDGYGAGNVPLNSPIEFVAYYNDGGGNRFNVSEDVSVNTDVSVVKVAQTVSSISLSSESIGSYTAQIDYKDFSETVSFNTVSIEEVGLVVDGWVPVIGKGQQLTLRSYIQYTNGSKISKQNETTWTSSDASVLSVSAAGKVTAKTEGMATITATVPGYSAVSKSFVVTEAILQVLELKFPTDFIEVGETAELSVTGIYSDGTQKEHRDDVIVVLDTLDYVDNSAYDYQLTAHAKGTTNVQVFLGDVESNVVQLISNDSPIDHISISLVKSLIPAGTSTPYTVTAHYTDGSEHDVTGRASVVVQDTTIATLYSSSTIKGHTLGDTTLFASYKGFSASYPFSVDVAEIIDFNVKPSLLSVAKGSLGELKAYAVYSNGKEIEVSNGVTWISDFPTIANVDAGDVNALAEGQTNIRVRLDGMESSTAATVTVTPFVDDADLEEVPGVNAFDVNLGYTKSIKFLLRLGTGAMVDVSAEAEWSVDDPSLGTIDTLGVYTPLQIGEVIVTGILKNASGDVAATYTATITNLPAPQVGIALYPDFIELVKASGEYAWMRFMTVHADGSMIESTVPFSCSNSNGTLVDFRTAYQTPDPLRRARFEAKSHPGQSTLTCSSNGFTATGVVKVLSPDVQSVSISSYDEYVERGSSTTIEIEAEFIDNSKLKNLEGMSFRVEGGLYDIVGTSLRLFDEAEYSVIATYQGKESDPVVISSLVPAKLVDVGCDARYCLGLDADGNVYHVGDNTSNLYSLELPIDYENLFWKQIEGVQAKSIAVGIEVAAYVDVSGRLFVGGENGVKWGFPVAGWHYQGDINDPISKMKISSVGHASSAFDSKIFALTVNGDLYMRGKNNGEDPFWTGQYDDLWGLIETNITDFHGAGTHENIGSNIFTSMDMRWSSPWLIKKDGKWMANGDDIADGTLTVESFERSGEMYLQNASGKWFELANRMLYSGSGVKNANDKNLVEDLVTDVPANQRNFELREIDWSLHDVVGNVDLVRPFGIGNIEITVDGQRYLRKSPLGVSWLNLGNGFGVGEQLDTTTLYKFNDDVVDFAFTHNYSPWGIHGVIVFIDSEGAVRTRWYEPSHGSFSSYRLNTRFGVLSLDHKGYDTDLEAPKTYYAVRPNVVE